MAITQGTRPQPVIVHLSGSHRGTTRLLYGERIRIGTGADTEIHFPPDREPAVSTLHAELRREAAHYALFAAPGETVRVNNELVESRVLGSNDLIEIGENGPFLRYRVYHGAGRPYKTVAEAFSDCVDCARRSDGGLFGRLGILLMGLPRELLTQTAPWSRTAAAALLIVLAVSVAALAARSWSLQRQLEEGNSRLRDISALLEQTEQNSLNAQELERIRADLEDRIAERLEALEERSLDAPRVISAAARSVVLLQGAYGFTERDSGGPLRVATAPDGRPLLRQYTGTAFVASAGGLLLTNRHLAQPWDFDKTSRALVADGWRPKMRRLLGYLPGVSEPFDLRLAVTGEAADVAVLCCSPDVEGVRPLELSDSLPQLGEEVVVLSYPTGIQALLARSDPAFVDSVMRDSARDFWSVARRLSDGGHIAPLATMGIVGQANPSAVVYDAETTRGSSGGPVLGADGRVLALNVAVMREFGGSNLGVPAGEARRVLELALRESAARAVRGDTSADTAGVN
jgi:serine protease Do